MTLPTTDSTSGASLVEIPVSDDEVGDRRSTHSDACVPDERDTLVGELESVSSPNAESVRARDVDDYDRPSIEQLRSHADELNWDVRSFVVLLSLSAIFATVVIVLCSPVTVVGSAVVAPPVNPMLIVGIGTAVWEGRMIRDNLRLQQVELLVIDFVPFAIDVFSEWLALSAETLDPSMVDQGQTRLAPNALTILVGVATSGAAAVSLTAESSPINIVGVMVAAALVPAAGATGLALAPG